VHREPEPWLDALASFQTLRDYLARLDHELGLIQSDVQRLSDKHARCLENAGKARAYLKELGQLPDSLALNGLRLEHEAKLRLFERAARRIVLILEFNLTFTELLLEIRSQTWATLENSLGCLQVAAAPGAVDSRLFEYHYRQFQQASNRLMEPYRQMLQAIRHECS
jgi:hypothetical protein